MSTLTCPGIECCRPSQFSDTLTLIYGLVVSCPFNRVIGYDPISVQVEASGGVEPYDYAITEGTLPPGLSLDEDTGIISGTPANINGSWTFTITVTDASSTSSSVECSVTVSLVHTGLVDYEGNPIGDYSGYIIGDYD